MKSLPMAPASCSLDQVQLAAQLERYRALGRAPRAKRRGERSVEVRVGPSVPDALIAELIDTERRCCPFFALHWEPAKRRLIVAVSRTEDLPALDAIALAIGVG